MNVLFDLTKRCSWGDKSYTLGCMSWYHKEGFKIYIKTNEWNNKQKDYLYNELVEPIDFFTNIIVPTFDCCFYDVPSGTKIGDWDNPSFDAVEKDVGDDKYFGKTDKFWPIDFKLSEKMKTDSHQKVKEELSKTTNWLVFSTYDDRGKYEKVKDRRRGLNMKPNQFEKQKNLIMDVDEICTTNKKNRIVLISKKANDWDKILKSEFFDLRSFEDLGLTFSQSFDLAVNQCSYMIGSRSSYQLWTNFSKRGVKISFCDKAFIPKQLHETIFINPSSLEFVLVNQCLSS